jgi:hypothetical protein
VPEDGFGDVPATAHEAAIDCVAWWGVTRGNGSGGFSPDATVTRDQMASFLSRAYAAGVAGGVGDERYAPGSDVRRAHMASFLARLLDVLVAGGHGAPPTR